VILDVLGWLVLADALAAAFLALLVYVAGRRSGHRVAMGKAVGLAGCLTIPAVLIYGIVWLFIRKM
jgi:hypothetical protein